MSGKTFILILLLSLPLFGISQVVEFMGRYDVTAVEQINDSTWKLSGEFVDMTGSYTGLDADTNDKVFQRGYNLSGQIIFDRYKIVGIDSQSVRILNVFVRSDFSSGVQNMIGTPYTGTFPIASPVSDTSHLTYKTSMYQNQIDPDYAEAIDNLNLREIKAQITSANDSVYANYKGLVSRSSEWIRNDTIDIDTTFARLYPGSNILITGSYPNYTVSAMGVSLVDSTHIKAGNGIRVDSVGKTFTITNISKDSTYIKSGNGIRIDSAGNTYTVVNTSIDSTYIVSGTNIRVDSLGNKYTINAINYPVDSTHVKSGNGIRIDSTGNTFTIVNISKDSTYIKSGTGIRVDSSGNTYTINNITQDSTFIRAGANIRVDSAGNTYTIANIDPDQSTVNEKDSIYAKYGVVKSVASEWLKNDTAFIDTTFTRIYSGSDNVTITGSYPNYTVAASSSVPGDSLSWYHNASRNSTYLRYPLDRVSIGTPATTANINRKLHVAGSQLIKDTLYFSSNNHYITEYGEGTGLGTDELFKARYFAAWGYGVSDNIGLFSNDNIQDGNFDSTVIISAKGNLALGEQTEQNERLYVKGTIKVPYVGQSASFDSLYVKDIPTNRLKTIHKSALGIFDDDSSAWIHNASRSTTYLRSLNDVVSIGGNSTNDINRRLAVEGSVGILDTLFFGTYGDAIWSIPDASIFTNRDFHSDSNRLYARGLRIYGNKLSTGDDFVVFSNDYDTDYDSTVRIHESGKIFARGLSKISSSDTLLAWDEGTGEFVAIPSSSVGLGGSVTSVGLVGSTGITVSGTSPITTSGTWTLTVADVSPTNEIQNLGWNAETNSVDITLGGTSAAIPVFSGGAAGLVQNIPSASDTLYLDGTGNWSSPIATMRASIYDSLSDHQTDLTALYDSVASHTDTLQSHNERINNLVKYDNKYEINVSNDSENNWNLPFELRSSSTILYNGDPLRSTQWSASSPTILTVTVDVRKYDHIVLIN